MGLIARSDEAEPAAGRREAGRGTARTRRVAALVWVAAGCLTAVLYAKSVQFARWERANAPPPPMPYVSKTRPAAGATDVLLNTSVAADVYLPNPGHGVSALTMNVRNVRLYRRMADGSEQPVGGSVNTSGAGDSIVFQPAELLVAGAEYHYVCQGVKDTSGALLQPKSMTFTTATTSDLSDVPVAFEHVRKPLASGPVFSGLTIGPDHRLYAGSFEGTIYRYDILPDGTLSSPAVEINTVRANNVRGTDPPGMRLITGICFDPRSTPADPVLWVTHGVCRTEHCPDWSCKLSRLSGPDLSTYQDAVVGLPRAYRDHLSFKIAFDPKDPNHLYFNQGSCSSTGAADRTWGFYPEHLLTAACLQVDVPAIERQMATGRPLNVKTEEDGHYDPWAPSAPLKLYATGIRSGFGLLFHRNGHLYSCINGGAEGGAAPGSPASLADVPHRIDGPYRGADVPAIDTVTETQADLFIDIAKGGYYGHPNETRGEYVLFGGNPKGEPDTFQTVHDYKVGLKPDQNFRPAAWNLGMSYSCNGLIEYKGPAFGGWLDGKILTTRYSSGKDVLVIMLDKAGRVVGDASGIDGLNGFVDPLDLVEDVASGCVYVSEWGGARLTLLRPTDHVSHQVFMDPKGHAALDSGAETATVR